MTVQEKRFETTVREIVTMVERSDVLLPKYETDTRKRDKALQTLWRSESLMSGVISAAVARDKNRGWTLTGTSGLVSKNAKKLHGAHGGIGWRNFVSLNALEWYTSNLGYVSEIVFQDGKPSTIYNIDSTRARLSANPQEPIEYYPLYGSKSVLKRTEILHANSLPSFEERLNYAGFCALERSLKFTKLMIGLHAHQLEKLGVAPPKGILLGKGIDRTEWNNALASFQEEKDNADTTTYQGVMGIFSREPNASLEMVGLSELPEHFNLRDWIDNIMKAYALAFGVPVYTFWTPESGTFGRGKEVSEMRKSSTYMGELEFALSFQEQIQKYFLPKSVVFDFNMRDDEQEITKLEVSEKLVEQVTSLTKEGIITPEQARQILVEEGVLPKPMYEGELSKQTFTDLHELRERALSDIETRINYERHPDEPLVVYEYEPFRNYTHVSDLGGVSPNALEGFPPGRLKVLFRDYDDYNSRRVF